MARTPHTATVRRTDRSRRLASETDAATSSTQIKGARRATRTTAQRPGTAPVRRCPMHTHVPWEMTRAAPPTRRHRTPPRSPAAARHARGSSRCRTASAPRGATPASRQQTRRRLPSLRRFNLTQGASVGLSRQHAALRRRGVSPRGGRLSGIAAARARGACGPVRSDVRAAVAVQPRLGAARERC